MWNGNEDEEGLKEVIEKGEAIEGIRVNGVQFVGIQKHERLNDQMWMWNDD